jgi:hypothetical protein
MFIDSIQPSLILARFNGRLSFAPNGAPIGIPSTFYKHFAALRLSATPHSIDFGKPPETIRS